RDGQLLADSDELALYAVGRTQFAQGDALTRSDARETVSRLHHIGIASTCVGGPLSRSANGGRRRWRAGRRLGLTRHIHRLSHAYRVGLDARIGPDDFLHRYIEAFRNAPK